MALIELLVRGWFAGSSFIYVIADQNINPQHNEAETKWPPFCRWHVECIFFNKNVWISIEISLKFAPKSPIKTHLPLDKMDATYTDDILTCIFFNENIWISIKFSLKFVPRGPIYNIPTLVQIMAWRRPGDKPSSEPMIVNLLTPCMRHSASMS